ncbi:LOW QUALITY PROTEIN: Neuropeptides B/W receptor type 2, partial [Plecturocebus cupreus]
MQAAGCLEPLQSRDASSLTTMGANVSQDNGTGHNATFSEPLPILYVLLPAVYSGICAMGLTGNTAVILVILRAPKMKTVTNVFILNLAIADGLFTLVLPVNIAEHLLQHWPFGELLCKLALAIDHYNIFSSIYFLAVMSITGGAGHCAVPPHALAHLPGAKVVSLCVWLGVTVLVLPFFSFAGVYSNELQVPSCGLSFPQPEQAWSKASRVYTLVLGFVVPVCTICVLYTDLLRRLRAVRLCSGRQGSRQGQEE